MQAIKVRTTLRVKYGPDKSLRELRRTKGSNMEACAESGRKLVCSWSCPLEDSF